MPEPCFWIYFRELDVAFELIGVDVTKLISTSRMMAEVCGKDGDGEAREDAFEKGSLLLWFDSIEL